MRRAITLVCLTFTVAACRDADTGPKSDGELVANVIPCDQQFIPEPGCSDPGGPIGGGINPNDSYATASAVQSITTTVSDDATGAVTVMPAPDVHFRLEVGHSPTSGLDVYQHVIEPREGGDETLRVIRVEGNVASEFGYDGLPAEPSPSDLDGSEANPLGGMPDLGMFPSLIEAVVSGNTGFVRMGALADKLGSVNASVVELSTGVSVRRLDADHIVLRVRTQPDASNETLFARSARGDWVLRQIDEVTDIRSAGKVTRLASRLRLKGVRHLRNAGADRMRDQKRVKRFHELRDATAITSARATMSSVPGVNLLPGEDSWSRTGIINWNPPTAIPFPIVPPTTPAPNAAPDKTAEETAGCVDAQYAAAQRKEAAPGPRIVFQHGFISGACTWAFQVPYFSEYSAGGRVVGNTYWPATYESQAAQLREQLPAGTPDWVFVGHSNGGIISRYLAQTSTPNTARAVITVNSPHAGADLPAATESFLNGTSFIFGVGQAIWNARSLGAASAGALFSNVSVVRQLLRGDAVVLHQMQPGSPFLNGLNQAPEPGYRKYAVRSRVSDDWMSVRVLCDARAPSSPGVPAGRACVKSTKRTVDRLVYTGGLFRLLAHVLYSIPAVGQALGNLVAPGLNYASRANFALTGMMYAIEWKWKESFCANQPCDGVVRMNSQVYPGADAERVINNADSHVGSTKSLTVEQRLMELVRLAYQ